MEKQNRADRRRNKFGGGRATEHGGWPTVRPNPVFEVENAGAEVAGADTPAAGTSPDKVVPETAPEREADKDPSPG
jgi:hypothetical protein